MTELEQAHQFCKKINKNQIKYLKIIGNPPNRAVII